MNKTHTPEPWRLLKSNPGQTTRIGAQHGNAPVQVVARFTNQMDAQRALSAVNACAGLPAIELEGIAAQGGLQTMLNRLTGENAQLRQDKADLIVFLKDTRFTLAGRQRTPSEDLLCEQARSLLSRLNSK